jgi:Cft2 family RNA processing exonuclease
MFSLAQRSLYVEALDLWIDSMRPRPRCYVSHGHADHARLHDVMVTSVNNAKVCRSRFAVRSDPQLLPTAGLRAACVFEEHAFNEPWREGDHELTLFPAGHVLGSAQLLIQGEDGRFVYTGDFKLAGSLTAEPPEVKKCDVLLMECTYGRPQYAFPPRDEIAESMAAWARASLEGGAVPIFYAYSLGKAQEAIAILGRAGLPLCAHGAIHTMTSVYREAGVDLPPCDRYDAATFDGAAVLMWPPSGKSLPKAVRGKTVRTASLTGWALDGSPRFRNGSGAAFPLSDHADYPALLRYIELAEPRRVLLNHGWKDFVHRLRALGVNASYLEANEQLSLF